MLSRWSDPPDQQPPAKDGCPLQAMKILVYRMQTTVSARRVGMTEARKEPLLFFFLLWKALNGGLLGEEWD